MLPELAACSLRTSLLPESNIFRKKNFSHLKYRNLYHSFTFSLVPFVKKNRDKNYTPKTINYFRQKRKSFTITQTTSFMFVGHSSEKKIIG